MGSRRERKGVESRGCTNSKESRQNESELGLDIVTHAGMVYWIHITNYVAAKHVGLGIRFQFHDWRPGMMVAKQVVRENEDITIFG
jgi:hypothetical protein